MMGTGNFGIGKYRKSGAMFTDLCQENHLIILKILIVKEGTRSTIF